MPLPKRRHSNRRTRLRRTHYKLNVPTVGTCPKCHAPRQPYHACPSCGFYNGRMVVEIKKKTPRE